MIINSNHVHTNLLLTHSLSYIMSLLYFHLLNSNHVHATAAAGMHMWFILYSLFFLVRLVIIIFWVVLLKEREECLVVWHLSIIVSCDGILIVVVKTRRCHRSLVIRVEWHVSRRTCTAVVASSIRHLGNLGVGSGCLLHCLTQTCDRAGHRRLWRHSFQSRVATNSLIVIGVECLQGAGSDWHWHLSHLFLLCLQIQLLGILRHKLRLCG